jgi:hypothetical protein
VSFPQRETVTVTTNGLGAGTALTSPIRGRLLSIIYEKVNFSDGVDFSVVTATTGRAIWVQSNVNASVALSPRAAKQSIDGGDATYQGSVFVLETVDLADEAVRFSVANGGGTTSGMFTVIWQ